MRRQAGRLIYVLGVVVLGCAALATVHVFKPIPGRSAQDALEDGGLAGLGLVAFGALLAVAGRRRMR